MRGADCGSEQENAMAAGTGPEVRDAGRGKAGRGVIVAHFLACARREGGVTNGRGARSEAGRGSGDGKRNRLHDTTTNVPPCPLRLAPLQAREVHLDQLTEVRSHQHGGVLVQLPEGQNAVRYLSLRGEELHAPPEAVWVLLGRPEQLVQVLQVKEEEEAIPRLRVAELAARG